MWPLAGVILIWMIQVSGQVTTNATCLSGFGWMNNSLDQTPCLVAAYLASRCNDGQWVINALLPSSQQYYVAPTGDSADPCHCNAVFYSLIQACSWCQGDTTLNWLEWTDACPSDFINQSYPYNVPNATQVPGWATMNPMVSGSWSASLSESYAASPSASRSAPAPSLAAATAPKPTSNNSNGNLVGAIVGASIGGLCLVFLACLLVWWLHRRDKRESIHALSLVPETPTTPGTEDKGSGRPSRSYRYQNALQSNSRGQYRLPSTLVPPSSANAGPSIGSYHPNGASSSPVPSSLGHDYLQALQAYAPSTTASHYPTTEGAA